MSRQLALPIGSRDAAVFEAYSPGPNALACEALRRVSQGEGEVQLFVWGAPQTGKTHLLQAVCHAAGAGGLRAAYVPAGQLSVHALEGLESLPIVCVDNLDAVAGDAAWELGLFNLINGLRERGHRLVLAARQSPARLPIQLKDLASRLLWGPVFHLQALNDGEKLQALRLRASRRGFELPEESARYLLHHQARDFASLMALLDRIDTETLAAQRKATIPFIRDLFNL